MRSGRPRDLGDFLAEGGAVVGGSAALGAAIGCVAGSLAGDLGMGADPGACETPAR